MCAAHHPFHLGEVLRGVHAQRFRDVKPAGRDHPATQRPQNLGAVGEVVLPLQVVRPHLRQGLQQIRAAERKAAGVDFLDRPLGRRRVLLLDDPDELPVLVPDNPSETFVLLRHCGADDTRGVLALLIFQ